MNLKIDNQSLFFSVDKKFNQIILDTFKDENSDINPYYQKFKSHQLDILYEEDIFKVNFSKQGIVELKTSSQDQALEIVRRRIDEIGTNEPNILKRGNDRILVELRGLDDPMRIKSLLGKTRTLLSDLLLLAVMTLLVQKNWNMKIRKRKLLLAKE